MKKIGTGRQAQVYEYDSRSAVKIYDTSIPIHYVENEADILKKIGDIYSKAPRFYDIWHQNGRYGLHFELIHGEMLSVQIARHLIHIRKYARVFGQLHREMHTYTVKGLRSAVDRFEWHLNQYKGLDTDMLQKLIRFININQSDSLCHGDLHPENIMVDEHGELRVIDWVDAYCGNPLSDVASTCYLLCKGTPPGKKPCFIMAIERILSRVIAKEYVRSYFNNEAYSKTDFDIWTLIIHICRYNTGIKEEIPFLEKSIPLKIEYLRDRL